jgi:hypothetical protein
MSETKPDSTETVRPSAFGQIGEVFRRSTSGEYVFCNYCGAVNHTGEEACENCGEALERPASMLMNCIDTIVRPFRAMPRLVATAPVLQAMLMVVLMIAIYIFMIAFTTKTGWDQALVDQATFNQLYPAETDSLPIQDRFLRFFFYVNATSAERDDRAKFDKDFQTELNKHTPEERLTSYTKSLDNPPVPGALFIVSQFLYLLISWVFFALAVYYVGRIFFRSAIRGTVVSLMAVVGFARITNLASLVFLLSPPVELSYGLTILLLAWQLGLIVIGTHFSTGLTWGRCAIVVVIPALLFRFLLGVPI